MRIALFGLTGYGALYLNCLLDAPEQHGVKLELVACVDPYAQSCPQIHEIHTRGIAGTIAPRYAIAPPESGADTIKAAATAARDPAASALPERAAAAARIFSGSRFRRRRGWWRR
jgi:hypothetical protein